MTETVHVVTRWVWGGGGDDKTEIVAIAATAERAEQIKTEMDAVRDAGVDEATIVEMSVQL